MRALYFLIQLHAAVALHFYVKHKEKRCFFEELPRSTLVVAKVDASKFDEHVQTYVKPSDLQLDITVEETFDKDHKVVSQRVQTPQDFKFTFTSLDSGEHKFCIQPDYKREPEVPIRIFVDVAIGQSNSIDSKNMDEVDWVMVKVQELAQKTEEVKAEHANIREREAVFRDVSETTNARVMRWALFEAVLLGGICFWQMQHLKRFFIKEKVI